MPDTAPSPPTPPAAAAASPPWRPPRTEPAAPQDAVQRVVKVRRDYNAWVARETMEDYALRFTPRAFRRWSELRVANTAFGAASFLVLEAVGATLLVQHGFVNAFWAILATGLVIFLAGLPISVYAARHGVDMDLLTRGAGFGYIGSTLTSLIYASFTFIFFALEAAIMAYALELAFGIPPAWGYLVCALVVIPLVTHGVSTISRLQVWTQPLWLVLLLVPYVFVLREDPGVIERLTGYAGADGQGGGFSLMSFGAAMTVGIALITQMGEQVDYLRFMPERTRASRRRWWAAVLIGGPGWVIPGVLKMLGGALLAYLAISHLVPPSRAVDPNQMYLAAWEYVFPNLGWAIAATALFVVVSQLKINVTNAYAGSLAWSNFFSRLTHHHPGRVVWMLFNIGIALLLMELDVFQALGRVLGLYANIAIAWMMAVVADLVVNKPLGLSPRGIEFRRAYLWDVNPVGVGAMGIASALSVAAHLGAFGEAAQAFSALIALVTAFMASPLIAWATGGRYYIARGPQAVPEPPPRDAGPPLAPREPALVPQPGRLGLPEGSMSDPPEEGRYGLRRCTVCERDYEAEDLAHCPAYRGFICSLCCTLDARCHDLCKPEARLSAQWDALLARLLPRSARPYVDTGLGRWLLLMAAIAPLLALLFGLLYDQELRTLGSDDPQLAAALRTAFLKAYAALLLVAGTFAWWLVLTLRSREVAQEESNRQTHALMREIESHRRTDEQLQQARLQAERARQQAEAANQAKSRYITTISHELRTPLNSILGYAQLLEEDEAMPAHRRQAVQVIRRGGDHLLSLIEGTLDIARIESGKFALDPRPMRLPDFLDELVRLFELQAAAKGLAFRHAFTGTLPQAVRADEKRLRQILINLLGNAVKFTAEGQVSFRLGYSGGMARFEIEDSGPGMSEQELARVFEPFVRGSAATGAPAGSTGLGLTIARMLTDLMGGEMSVRSTPGAGTCFSVKLYLPGTQAAVAARERPRDARSGYRGPRRRILVVDNEEADRGLLLTVLGPLGFQLAQAASGFDALALLRGGLQPHAILMDLAMPGIDGWETIRTIRRERLSEAPVAIVSANAFDKGLDNDAGIAAEDFFVKPVRVAELLDWLGRRLALQWVEPAEPPAEPAASPPAAALVPADAQAIPGAELRALAELVDLGYLRGILKKLDEIEAAGPDAAGRVAPWRALARQFQFDTLAALLRRQLHAGPTP